MIKRRCSRHTWENCSHKMSDLSSQPNLNKNIKDSYFNLSLEVEKSQNLELFFVKGRKGCELNELKMNWKWINSWMGMGIEPFSIHEWEWELIPIFSQWMGMGINSPKMMNGPKSVSISTLKQIKMQHYYYYLKGLSFYLF